ncbi:MAG: DUF4249 family protein [Bacteroidales bacterium]|nr:DUF4249 family protein [Bacteroidales bacterium]
MKRFRFILIIFTSLLAVSCENLMVEVKDVNLPHMDPVLNVVCFLSPDEPIEVHVIGVEPIIYNRATKVKYNSDYFVTNAQVRFGCVATGQQFDLVYVDSLGVYVCPDGQPKPSIEQGGEYTLRVEAEGYPTATAMAVMPQADFACSNIEGDVQKIENEYRGHFRFNLENSSSSEQVFRVISHLHGLYERYDYSGYDGIKVDTVVGYSLFMESYETVQPCSSVVVLHKNIQHIQWSTCQYFDSVSFEVMLVDPDYQKYHESIIANAPDLLILGQPDGVYSNINGGLGIFVGYIRRQVTSPINYTSYDSGV